MKDFLGFEKRIKELPINTLEALFDFIERPTEINLIRHAEPKSIRLQDDELFLNYNPPLSESGIIQAKQVAPLVKKSHVILTSPSNRTRQTAEIISGANVITQVIAHDLQDSGFAKRWPLCEIKSILGNKYPEKAFQNG